MPFRIHKMRIDLMKGRSGCMPDVDHSCSPSHRSPNFLLQLALRRFLSHHHHQSYFIFGFAVSADMLGICICSILGELSGHRGNNAIPISRPWLGSETWSLGASILSPSLCLTYAAGIKLCQPENEASSSSPPHTAGILGTVSYHTPPIV
jgi:hypothetical protein